MSSRSRRRPLLRIGTLAFAVVLGAGAASAAIVVRELKAVTLARQSASPTPDAVQNASGGGRQTPTTTTTTTPPPPPVSSLLPFNAKLASQDIPDPAGGVRSGGCSGSLVAPQWVITAGHCFHDINDVRVGGVPPYTMTVTIGKLKDSDPGGRTAQVVDVRQSPVNDLAVVKLSAPVLDVVPLTLADEAPAIGQQLQFAGWGSTSATVIAASDHLKRGMFSISAIGPSTFEALPVVPRTVENSPCPEDSGAPFFISPDDKTGQLVAIVSTGPACPQPGAEIIARVDVQADWIREQTGGTAR
ncbi:S1 family peptidase [Umezawaea tangerina]|uniref:Trypsin n=1 Tax=Umezawaea tangerina TaxID=84725 RepID=A0A2T0T7Z0_9PSEU|nr:trypsin-like serine protease [Umezawaea tangerina]PRY41766.1 trypsin [Umezawaea tangerina]